MAIPLIEELNRRFSKAKTDADSWRTEWRRIRDHYEPRSGMFLNEGDSKSTRATRRNFMIRSTDPLRARRIYNSGLSSLLLNPASRWFRHTTPDRDLRRREAVKMWFSYYDAAVYRIYARSNFYGEMNKALSVNGLYGTACPLIEQDRDNVINVRSMDIGEFYLEAPDLDGRVRGCFREMSWPTQSFVDTFPVQALPREIRNDYDKGDYGREHKLRHAIFPRERFSPKVVNQSDFPSTFPFVSVYWHYRSDQPLLVQGYREEPVFPFRWATTGNESYGTTSPGMDTIADVIQAYDSEGMRAKATEIVAAPATQGPPGSNKVNKNRNAHNIVSQMENRGIRSIYDYQPDLNALANDRAILSDRISTMWFNDVFSMFSTLNKRERMVTTEADALRAEQLMQLSPFLINTDYELLNRVDERVGAMIFRLSRPRWAAGQPGIVPPPPPELQGVPIYTTYTSTLHRAVDSYNAQGVTGLINFAMTVAGADPTLMKKIDLPTSIDVMAEVMGVPPEIVVGADEFQQIQAADARRMEEQETMSQMSAMADMANKGAEAVSKLDA